MNILKGYSNYSVKKTEWKAGVNKVGIFQRILQACGVLDWGNGDSRTAGSKPYLEFKINRTW